jgi:hypothetical protein
MRRATSACGTCALYVALRHCRGLMRRLRSSATGASHSMMHDARVEEQSTARHRCPRRSSRDTVSQTCKVPSLSLASWLGHDQTSGRITESLGSNFRKAGWTMACAAGQPHPCTRVCASCVGSPQLWLSHEPARCRSPMRHGRFAAFARNGRCARLAMQQEADNV